MRRFLLLSMAAAATACGRKPPPVGPVPMALEAAVRCGKAMWKPGEARPANLEVVNRSLDSVSVWLDRCDGHTWVVNLGTGDSTVVPLPSGAASFEGRLRFITYRGPTKSIAVEVVSPEANPNIRLVVPETAVECPRVYVDGKLYEQPLSTITRERIESVDYLPSSSDGECMRINVRLKSSPVRSRGQEQV